MTAAPSPKETRHNTSLVLERFAPYRIVALGHALSGRLARTYADENITIPEWRVLAVVAQADEIAARDVVQRTPMDKMTVSRAVASLEEKGFVLRRINQSDRRVNVLSLSEAGRALFERVESLALDYEKEFLSVLSDAEKEAFDGSLSKLEQSVRAAPSDIANDG